MNRANISRLKRILWVSFIYVLLSHIPLLLTYVGFKMLLHNPENSEAPNMERQSGLDYDRDTELNNTLYGDYYESRTTTYQDMLLINNNIDEDDGRIQSDPVMLQDMFNIDEEATTSMLPQQTHDDTAIDKLNVVFKNILSLILYMLSEESSSTVNDKLFANDRFDLNVTREHTVVNIHNNHGSNNTENDDRNHKQTNDGMNTFEQSIQNLFEDKVLENNNQLEFNFHDNVKNENTNLNESFQTEARRSNLDENNFPGDSDATAVHDEDINPIISIQKEIEDSFQSDQQKSPIVVGTNNDDINRIQYTANSSENIQQDVVGDVNVRDNPVGDSNIFDDVNLAGDSNQAVDVNDNVNLVNGVNIVGDAKVIGAADLVNGENIYADVNEIGDVNHDVNNLGEVNPVGDVDVNPRGDVNHFGEVNPVGDVDVNPRGDVNHFGEVNPVGDVDVNPGGDVNHFGEVNPDGEVDVNPDDVNNFGEVNPVGDVDVNLNGDVNHFGEVNPDGEVDVNPDGDVNNYGEVNPVGDVDVNPDGDVNHFGEVNPDGDVDVAVNPDGDLNNFGEVNPDGDVDVNPDGDVNHFGEVNQVGDVNIQHNEVYEKNSPVEKYQFDLAEDMQQRKLRSVSTNEERNQGSVQNINEDIQRNIHVYNTNLSRKTADEIALFHNIYENNSSLFPYIQPRSILNTKPEKVFDLENLQYIPGLKNPCFFVEAIENETRIANTSLTLKCLPYFFIFGTEKCATSDLYYRLRTHQHVHVPMLKETQWFNNMRQVGNVNHHNGTLGGYNSMFKRGLNNLIKYCSYYLDPKNIKKAASNKMAHFNCSHVLLDATPRYLHNSYGISSDPLNAAYAEPRVLVAHRVQHLLPYAKLILMFRNPTDRLFSAYKYFAHYSNKTISLEDFHGYVLNGTRAWHTCINITSEKNCAYGFKLPATFFQSSVYNFASFNQIRTGLYYLYLRDVLPLFPRENMLMIEFEEYSNDPLKYINTHILHFVGLKPFDLMASSKLYHFSSDEKIFNKDSSKFQDMWPSTREILENFYRRYNMKLGDLLNDSKFTWTS